MITIDGMIFNFRLWSINKSFHLRTRSRCADKFPSFLFISSLCRGPFFDKHWMRQTNLDWKFFSNKKINCNLDIDLKTKDPALIVDCNSKNDMLLNPIFFSREILIGYSELIFFFFQNRTWFEHTFGVVIASADYATIEPNSVRLKKHVDCICLIYLTNACKMKYFFNTEKMKMLLNETRDLDGKKWKKRKDLIYIQTHYVRNLSS